MEHGKVKGSLRAQCNNSSLLPQPYSSHTLLRNQWWNKAQPTARLSGDGQGHTCTLALCSNMSALWKVRTQEDCALMAGLAPHKGTAGGAAYVPVSSLFFLTSRWGTTRCSSDRHADCPHLNLKFLAPSTQFCFSRPVHSQILYYSSTNVLSQCGPMTVISSGKRMCADAQSIWLQWALDQWQYPSWESKT